MHFRTGRVLTQFIRLNWLHLTFRPNTFISGLPDLCDEFQSYPTSSRDKCSVRTITSILSDLLLHHAYFGYFHTIDSGHLLPRSHSTFSFNISIDSVTRDFNESFFDHHNRFMATNCFGSFTRRILSWSYAGFGTIWVYRRPLGGMDLHESTWHSFYVYFCHTKLSIKG